MDPRRSPFPTEDLLDRYFSGEVSPEERKIVQEKLSAYSGDLEYLLKNPSRVNLAPLRFEDEDANALWNTVVARIANRSVTPRFSLSRVKAVVRHPRRSVRVGAVVAAGIIAVMFGLGRWEKSHTLSRWETSGTRTMVTLPGQQANFDLPDGSSVKLAPGTTLRYSSTFGDNVREVSVIGEALFTVVNSHSAPFVVHMGTSTIRVLGTTFAARRYTTDTAARVVVAQGKVAVANRILTSGEAASVTLRDEVRIDRGVDIASALAWTTGSLLFRVTPLRQVIPEFHRWYGLNITVRDPRLLDQTITAEFFVHAPEDALDILSQLLHVRVVRMGDRILLDPIHMETEH